MTAGSADPIVTDPPLFCMLNTDTHKHTSLLLPQSAFLTENFCQYHLSFKEWVNCLNRGEWWRWFTPLPVSVWEPRCLSAYTSTSHLEEVDRCPPMRDACVRYGNVWINVTRPHLAACVTSSQPRWHDSTANYRSCNSLHPLLSITSTICSSVIHLQVRLSLSLSLTRHSYQNIIRLWGALIDRHEQRKMDCAC